MSDRLEFPRKVREIQNHHIDSTIWNQFQFRDDDVVIASYGKSGTTWVQQIIAQILFSADPELDVADMSPWVDLRIPPKVVKLRALAAQTHRRFVKTHLPVDALVFSGRAKYIYVGRDGRDVLWSLYHHHAKANGFWYSGLNDTPGRVGAPIAPPPDDVREYWRQWIDGDGYPFWSFWDNVRTWWEIRALENVLFVHFDGLKRDLRGEMGRIAAFLDVPIEPRALPAMAEHCSFDWMKRHASKSAPLGGALWQGGAETFINQGINGRWRGVLTPSDVEAYEARAQRELGAACAKWIASGEG